MLLSSLQLLTILVASVDGLLREECLADPVLELNDLIALVDDQVVERRFDEGLDTIRITFRRHETT